MGKGWKGLATRRPHNWSDTNLRACWRVGEWEGRGGEGGEMGKGERGRGKYSITFTRALPQFWSAAKSFCISACECQYLKVKQILHVAPISQAKCDDCCVRNVNVSQMKCRSQNLKVLQCHTECYSVTKSVTVSHRL